MAVGKDIKDKIVNKKRKKESELYKAAYELIISKGLKNTAIDDIVKRAGVAKGTFYLYFKDKEDILNRLILKKSSQIIKEALAITEEKKFDSFQHKTVFFIEYIIDYFKENVVMLKIINKNFSWGIFRKALMGSEESKEVKIVIRKFIEELSHIVGGEKQAEITLFIIFELVGSTCYSSIILGEPDDIEVVKPVLIDKVIKIIT